MEAQTMYPQVPCLPYARVRPQIQSGDLFLFEALAAIAEVRKRLDGLESRASRHPKYRQPVEEQETP